MALSRRDRRVQRLDLMSYQQKSTQWKVDDPLGSSAWLPTAPALAPKDVITDKCGNIISVPRFAEKPCFGIPTAWLRHARRKPVYVKRLKEKTHNRPCDRCLASEACRSIVLERIKYVARDNSPFARHLKNWVREGGLEKGGFDVAYTKLKHRGWSALTYPLESADFSDSNAENVRRYWIEKKNAAAKVAAGKERFRLRQAWKSGEELSNLREGLTEGAKVRAVAFHEAKKWDDPPKYLRSLPSNSIARICNVWWAREFARYTSQDRNASRIARIAIEQRRLVDYSHTSLRQMVKRDLEVIRQLESSAGYNGGTPLWPKFKHPAVS